MRKFLSLLLLLPSLAFAQTTAYHRISQVIARAPQGGANAQVVPYATIAVTNSFTGTAQTIYYDYALSTAIPTSTVKSDASGNYGYYLALNQCATETISYPGMVSPTILTYVCSFGAGAISGISTPSGGGLLSSTSSGIATIQVNPAMIPFLTTSTPQTFSGNLVMPGITVSGIAAGSGHDCLQVDTSGVLSNTGSPCNTIGFPGSGIPLSTGTAWGTSFAAQGSDTALLTAGTVSGSGATLCTDANGGATTVGCPGGGISYPGAGIPLSTGSSWSTSYSAQGTDTKLLTAGTVSGTGATLCTDANGGATTSGCAAAPIFQTNGSNNSLQTTLNLIAGTGISLVNSGGGVTINQNTAFTGTSGYQQFPSGLVLEWGQTTPGASSVTITLPSALMHSCFVALASTQSSGGGGAPYDSVGATCTTTSVTVNLSNTALTVGWFVIGW